MKPLVKVSALETKATRFKAIDLDIKAMLNNDYGIFSVVVKAIRTTISNINKRTTSSAIESYDHIRELLNIPNLAANTYNSKVKFPIEYVTKVRLINFVHNHITPNKSHLAYIFKINERKINALLDSRDSRIALALNDYFLNRTLSLKDLRAVLKAELGITFSPTGLSTLTEKQIKLIKFSLIRTIGMEYKKLIRLFGCTSDANKVKVNTIFGPGVVVIWHSVRKPLEI